MMSDWKCINLGDLIELHYGKNLPFRKRIDGDIPVFSSAGLTGYHNEPLVNSKGIILGRKGTIGKVYISDEPFFAIDTTYFVLPNDEVYNFDFLYYLLKSLGLERLNEDTAVPGLNRDTAYSQKITIPENNREQEAISSVLKSLDDKIDLLQRQNQTLEALAQTLFRQWFVEEKEGKWEEGELADYCDVIDCLHSKKPEEITPVEGSKFLLQVYNISDRGSIDLSDKYYVSNEDYSEWTRRIEVREGDLIISKTGRVGAIAQIPDYVVSGLGRNLVAIRGKETYTPEYLKDLMLSKWMDRNIKLSTSDGTILRSLHVKSISGLPAINPGTDLIYKYSDLIRPFHKKVMLNLKSIENLRQIRDILLPKLMSGEVRVEI